MVCNDSLNFRAYPLHFIKVNIFLLKLWYNRLCIKCLHVHASKWVVFHRIKASLGTDTDPWRNHSSVNSVLNVNKKPSWHHFMSINGCRWITLEKNKKKKKTTSTLLNATHFMNEIGFFSTEPRQIRAFLSRTSDTTCIHFRTINFKWPKCNTASMKNELYFKRNRVYFDNLLHKGVYKFVFSLRCSGQAGLCTTSAKDIGTLVWRRCGLSNN